ELCCPMERSS
nr:RecName: Full=Snaclec trowaglerix subunit beta [Tropidolaemus wagleri]